MGAIKHIGFGCVGLSTCNTQKAALRVLETAFDNGITHFDTAPIYGKGFSEKILSVFLKNKRDKVTIATKAGLFTNPINIPVWAALPLNAIIKKVKGSADPKISFEQAPIMQARAIEKHDIQKSIAESLNRLEVENLDYLLLHEALPHFLSDEASTYLFSLKQQGVVNKLGIAASAVNIETLNNIDIKNWDVLQYENAVQYKSDSIINTFPKQEHIYHSIFKTLLLLKKEKIDMHLAPGILMARSYLNNPNGKVLFSTTNIDHLKKNVRVFEEYAKLPKTEVDNLVNHAIS